MTIAIDFDGTITEHPKNFPQPGNLRPYARDVINGLIEQGHNIILWTCRDGKALDIAKNFLVENDIRITRFNEQTIKSCSNKIVADIYIDDRAFPQCFNDIDWQKIGKIFNIFI